MGATNTAQPKRYQVQEGPKFELTNRPPIQANPRTDTTR